MCELEGGGASEESVGLAGAEGDHSVTGSVLGRDGELPSGVSLFEFSAREDVIAAS